jgi:hypothetical protein
LAPFLVRILTSPKAALPLIDIWSFGLAFTLSGEASVCARSAFDRWRDPGLNPAL